MSVSKERLLDLMKAQCRIFSTTYNPERLKTGNKILHARLRGPSAATYYPPRVATFKDLERAFKPLGLRTWDEKEEDRLDSLERAKARGKGAPKKKKTPSTGRKK